uniref:UBC core domain-containing protein n=1 Tax=Caenorhabditis japonica TaxID=281687 RepID=A0A8R1DG47_CAEJA
MSLTPQAATHGRVVQLSRVRKDGSAYKNQLLTVHVDVSIEYPFKPPYIKFCHEMYHPNVDPASFELCSAMLIQENWKPETTIEDVLLNVIVLLNEPDLSRPVNMEAASDYIHEEA